MSTQKQRDKAEALQAIREIIEPGDTLFTVLRHVSASGMTRWIDVYKLVDGDRLYLSGYAATLLDESQPHTSKHGGVRVTGCGMDMGFHLVYNLSWVVFHDDPRWTGPQDAGYALDHRWM